MPCPYGVFFAGEVLGVENQGQTTFVLLLTCPPPTDKMTGMEFIETSIFTRMVTELLSDEKYRELQGNLVDNPERGNVVKGGGGIRKLRHATGIRGKSGGVRVIYFWVKERRRIYLLVMYHKSKKDTLTDHEVAILRELVKEL